MPNEHLTEALWDIPKTAIGFFLALTLHRLVGMVTDKRAFRAMLRTIHAEVKCNEVILNKSFREFYREGLVLRQFSTETAAGYLKDPRFLERARADLAELLHQYVRNINLANSYRSKAEEFRINKPKSEWLAPLIEVWGKNLEACRQDMRSLDKMLKPWVQVSWWERLVGGVTAKEGD